MASSTWRPPRRNLRPKRKRSQTQESLLAVIEGEEPNVALCLWLRLASETIGEHGFSNKTELYWIQNFSILFGNLALARNDSNTSWSYSLRTISPALPSYTSLRRAVSNLREASRPLLRQDAHRIRALMSLRRDDLLCQYSHVGDQVRRWRDHSRSLNRSGRVLGETLIGRAETTPSTLDRFYRNAIAVV